MGVLGDARRMSGSRRKTVVTIHVASALGQAEAHQGRRVAEDGDLGDPVALEREHEEFARQERTGLVTPRVHAERRLAVGARRDDAPAHLAAERKVAQERRDRVAAAEPRRIRRHREGGVLGKPGSERLDVRALPGVDESADELAQPGIAERAQRRLLASLGKTLVDGLVCTLQCAVQASGVIASESATSAPREAEHVTQDQHGTLSRCS
jgi:hypothetical protein